MRSGQAESLGNRIGGNVVMGRANAASGEDIVVAGAQRIHRSDDFALDIRHHPDLAHFDTPIVQRLRQMGEIGILGPARQDLVADDREGGGIDSGVGGVVCGRHGGAL